MVAPAVGPDALSLHEDERGREDGGGCGQLLEPSVEHPSDECGVIGDTHGRLGPVAGYTCVDRLSEKNEKNQDVRPAPGGLQGR
jgi:hypothetical protein